MKPNASSSIESLTSGMIYLPFNVIDRITLTPFKNRLDKYCDFNPQ